jgi:hypothetical protein
MGEVYEVQTGEDIIADLIRPADYLKHRNQVAAVTDQRVVALKMKFVGEAYVFEDHAIQECTSIDYKKTYALGGMIGGAVLSLIGLLVIYYAITGQLTGLGVLFLPIFLLGTGGALVFGVRRHKMVFHLGLKKLVWVSGPGEFKDRVPAIADIAKFAKERGIITTIPAIFWEQP